MSSYPAESEVVAGPLQIETRIAQPSDGVVHNLLRRWWIPFGASSLFVVSGHLLIKSGLSAGTAGSLGAPLWTRIVNCVMQGEVAAGLAVYFLGSLCWMLAVAQQEISFLYPLSSMNYVLVVIASSMFFGESVSLRRMSGVALIMLGMVLMNRPSRSEAR
jgi:drug/metabolite transporter (DMT)-like permease